MGSATTPNVVLGFYKDHGKTSLQWLVEGYWAGVLTNALGTLVTIALMRLWKIAERIYYIAHEKNLESEGVHLRPVAGPAGLTTLQAGVQALEPRSSSGSAMTLPPAVAQRQGQSSLFTSSQASSRAILQGQGHSTSSAFSTSSHGVSGLLLRHPLSDTSSESSSHAACDAPDRSPPQLPRPPPVHFPSDPATAAWDFFLQSCKELRSRKTIPDPASQRATQNSWPARVWIWFIPFAKSVIFTAIYGCVIAAGVAVSLLATDTVGLSNAPDCGFYSYSSNDAFTASATFGSAASDSARLVLECYDAPTGSDGCTTFLYNRIDHTVKRGASCPFEDGMCFDGPRGAIEFQSVPVDARMIGINSPIPLQYQRTTTCAPLNMNSSFITKSSNGTENVYDYKYGPTWFGSPHGKDVTIRIGNLNSGYKSTPPSSYILRSASSRFDQFQPIPALSRPAHSTLTLLFVFPQNIFYLNKRDDPIFPAGKAVPLPPSNVEENITELWRYNGPHARVLACVDKTEWRMPELSMDWSPWQDSIPKLNTTTEFSAFFLFWFSLMSSTISDSLLGEQEPTLNASTLLNGPRSYHLAENQWELEAERLFRFSLARTQVDARNIARGAWARYPGAVLTSNDMCHQTYLFQTQGYRNVNAPGAFAVFFFSVVIWLLALRTRPHSADLGKMHSKDPPMWFELVIPGSHRFARWIVPLIEVRIPASLVCIWAQLMSVWMRVRGWQRAVRGAISRWLAS